MAEAQLLEAAETGSIERALSLLDEGISAFSVDQTGYTALHKAAFMGYDELAYALIEREPHLVDACDITHNTPLHVAAWTGHTRTAEALLEASANVSAADLAGNTPLHRAVLEGQTGVPPPCPNVKCPARAENYAPAVRRRDGAVTLAPSGRERHWL